MTDYNYNVFATQTLAQDTYYHTFYQVSQENPNTMTTYTYDNSKNLIETFDVSFGAFSVSEALQILDQNGANPYVVGTNSTGTEFRSMDIGYFDIYNRLLTTSQHKGVMTKVNKTDLRVLTNSELRVLTNLVIYISPQSQLTNNGTNYTNWVTNYASRSPVSNIRISNVPTTGTYNDNNLSDDINNDIYDNFNTGSTFANGVFNLKNTNVMYFINNEYDFTNGFTIAFRISTSISEYERVLQITTHQNAQKAIDLTWSTSFRGRPPYFPDEISNSVSQTGYYVFTVSSSECVFYYNGVVDNTITTSDSEFKGSDFLSSISSTGAHKYFRIGAVFGISNMNFDMDEFRIYNKVLSADDVQTLYNNLP